MISPESDRDTNVRSCPISAELADSLAETLYAERNAMFLQRHYNPAFPVLSILEDMSG